MRYKQKQKQIEEKTYGMIDEIANEFDLKVQFYPEIYWVGKKLKFEKLGIQKQYKKEFQEIKEKKGAIYFYEPKIILIAENVNSSIAEEAGHFVHYTNSKVNPNKMTMNNYVDHESWKILSEAIGYFCSKLIAPERKPIYGEFKNFENYVKDYYNKKGVEIENLEEMVKDNLKVLPSFFVYKHGYDLGEEIYNHYISGNINKKQIRNLIKNPFKEEFSATKKFLYLREKYLKNNPHLSKKS
ncbi:hypothetical protein HYT91_00670 [Candidatus Pacearchaeota archaeon]|nr:hypothetical protein [Candidatus Pacearchaeota archaeon]